VNRIDQLLQIRAGTDALIQRELAKEALREKLAEVPQEADTTIFFRKLLGGRVYTYAAVCYASAGMALVGPGYPSPPELLWSTTGPRSPKNYTWSQLCDWLLDGAGVEELWLATTWEQVL
jgi:hypothetical protein